MKSVLLTGATGFIGRACVRPLLERGYEVYTISRSWGPTPLQGVVSHRGDLLDLDSLPDLLTEIAPSHLLHTAWDVTHGAYWTDPDNLVWLAAGARLLHAFHAAGGRRAVGVGSCAEYAWNRERYHETESRLAAATPYGACKAALCQAFDAARGLGLETAWGRLFFPYGPHEKPDRLLPSVIGALLAGRPVDCTDGRQVRDFLFVEDVAAALVALLDAPVEGPVNIASGTGLSLRQVVEEVIAQLGGADLVRFGALPTRPGDPPVLIGDSRRLTEEVGFRPAAPLDQGIARTIAYWRGIQKSASVTSGAAAVP